MRSGLLTHNPQAMRAAIPQGEDVRVVPRQQRRSLTQLPRGFHTLLLATSSTNAANPYLYKKTGFDPVKDFTPVASVALIPSVLVVPAGSKFKSPQEIIAAAKATPGKLS